MNMYKYIKRDPNTMGGLWCLAGHRITVAHALASLSEGMTVGEFARDLHLDEKLVSNALVEAGHLIDRLDISRPD